MGKKEKKTEKAAPDDVFDALNVESRQAATVVLMLNSPEEDVQAKACEAIYKFADKCEENKKLLLDLKAVDPLLRLMQGEDTTVRRFATMGLGVMCQHPDVRKCLRKTENSIPILINLLQTDIGDSSVNEFAALAVSYMATEFSSKVAIFDNGGIEPLVKLLTNPDPDVQKNSIEALAQMVMDYQARGSVREYDGFPPILELLKSEYAIIQKLALLTLDRLTQDAENRNTLRELEGIAKLLDFLARPDWNDLHVMAVMVISSMLEDRESLEQMKESGGLKKLVALITDQPPPEEESKKGDKKSGSRAGKKSANKDAKKKEEEEKEVSPGGDVIIPTLPDVKMSAAKAIARCARSGENRKILHDLEVEKMLIVLLNHESPDVQAAAAQGLGVLCENLVCRDSVREWEGLPALVRLLGTECGDVKEAVTLALANLTSSNVPNCQELVNLNGLDAVVKALGDPQCEVVTNAACILTNMAQDEALRGVAHKASVITAFIAPLGSPDTNVQSKSALAVSAFACDADARISFREMGGLEPLVKLLNSGNNEVRRNAAWAINVCGVDEPTATEICKLGGLEVLQELQLSGSRQSPFIEAAMERLLDSNLSAKYALTGHLSPQNLIEDGFYDPGQQRPGTKFRTLDDYLSEALNDKRPVFYISAKQAIQEEMDNSEDSASSNPPSTATSAKGILKKSAQQPSESDESELRPQSKTQKKPKAKKTDTKTKTSKSVKTEAEKQKQKEEEEAEQKEKEEDGERRVPPAPPTDPDFVSYLEEATDWILPLPSVKDQIVALAQFVSEKMGGPIEKGQLAYFGWELPLSHVRFEGKTNVVAIGKIRMGIHTHRALLFKALADRLTISCTLTRGQYNRAWNEVTVVDQEPEPGALKFPPKPYIVDLIHEPGKLLALDSHEAVAYKKI